MNFGDITHHQAPLAPAPLGPRVRAEHERHERSRGQAHAFDATSAAANADADANAYGCVEWFDFDAHATPPPQRAEAQRA